MLLAVVLVLSVTGCGEAAPEQTVPVTTEATVTPESTAAPETTEAASAIDTPQALQAALDSQLFVTLEGSVTLEKSIVFSGGQLDGGGNTLTAPAYVEEQTETHNGLTVRSGNVRNMRILGGYRALGDSRDYPLTGSIRLEDLYVEGQTTAINFGYGKTDGTLNAENCTFYGWSSYKGFSSAYFENCTFGKGGSDSKGNLRPYISTTLIGCRFESHTTASGTEVPFAILLTDKISGITLTMEDCYVGDTLITQENVYELLEIKLYDNILRVCNTGE